MRGLLLAADPMNHFLALIPDPATCDRLAALQDRLRVWNLPARWTHPDDLHLTVWFLGDCDEQEASLTATLVAEVAASARRPALRLAGLGASGSVRGAVPRAVYAAVADAERACFALHCDLADCLAGDAQTHAFLPHLTLARPQAGAQPAHGGWPALLEAHGDADGGPCVLTTLALLRSHPERRPRYERLESWTLV
ncbi:MAG: RNA 2',3'-cyclic phosphodiesterase [Planctomycetes bacterium]|nr:RNA 2',3'-cyclic phosphodiesterase [Planctomycetota bacterium]